MAGIDSYRDAISGIESSGRYNLLGPVTRDGDRAYGKYQIMGKNVGPWTREVLGREMSPQEFAADPAAQDAVFNAKFGGYVSKYGPEGAARAWFAGEGGMNDPNRKDVLGTSVAQYARKFNTAIGAPQGGGSPAPQGGSQMNPLLLMQNEQTQEQPQQGGLLGGLFNDPGKMAALQLLMSGLNPFSKGNEMEPFIRAAQLRQTQDYNRKRDERDFGLREKQFLLNQQNIETDNKRADEQFKWQKESAMMTDRGKALRELGYEPGTEPYKIAYTKMLGLEKEGWKAVTIKNGGVEQTFFQNDKGEFKRPEDVIPGFQSTPAQPKYDDLSSMRKEYIAQPNVKSYEQSIAPYQSMMKSAGLDTATSDLDLIYGLARVLDPDSVVREGEFATVQKSNSIPERVKGQLQYVLEGKGKLTPESRAQLMQIARNRVESYREQAQGQVGRYRYLAGKRNFDPDEIAVDLPETPRWAPPKSDAKATPKAGLDVDGSLANARAAIAKNPAARDAVIQRLRENGIDPSGL